MATLTTQIHTTQTPTLENFELLMLVCFVWICKNGQDRRRNLLCKWGHERECWVERKVKNWEIKGFWGAEKWSNTENDSESGWPAIAGVNHPLLHAALSSHPKILQYAPHRAQALATAKMFLYATFAVMKKSAKIKVLNTQCGNTFHLLKNLPPLHFLAFIVIIFGV